MWIYASRQTALLKFKNKKKRGGKKKIPVVGKSPSWVFFKQNFHSVHFWSGKIDIYRNLHSYGIAHTSLQYAGVHLKMGTNTYVIVRKSLHSVPPRFSANASLWAGVNQLNSTISTKLPNLHQLSGWHRVYGSAKSPRSLLQDLCKVAAALNANGYGSAEHWYQGVISFMGTFL